MQGKRLTFTHADFRGNFCKRLGVLRINVWCAAWKGTFATKELVNRIARVDLSKIVTKLATEIRQTNPARNVELIAKKGLTAFADETMVAIVLDNLLGNA